jgi:hypothetical protein
MIKMEKDLRKSSNVDIANSPGRLAAQIVFNQLVENEMFFWVIGNVQGNKLFTVSLNNGQDSIVGFTDENLIYSYVNRKLIKKNILNSFGRSIVLLNISFRNLDKILNNNIPFSAAAEDIIDTVIINHNTKDFFIPMNIIYNSEVMEKNIENISRDISDVKLLYLKYDSDSKMYVDDEEKNKEDNEEGHTTM